MSDTNVDINLRSRFDSSGTSAATKAFSQLQEARAKANQAASASKADAENQALARSAQQAAQGAQRAEAAFLRAARAEATLASASGESARAITILSNALQQVDRTSLGAIQTQTQLARAMKSTADSSAALPRTFAGVTDEVKGMIAGSLGVGAALTAVAAAGQSFQDAFNFKAELDASTASINVQLGAVRNTGQVWQEASAYAAQYKLTQAQTVQAIGASINVLKNSSASVGETLEALQRLNLANTEESIDGAAFALAELASGDINSIVERFRVSRDEAYAMRDAIAAGADPVAVLTSYLDKAGLSAAALRTQTEGVVGAQKDLAIAQEQLALAQAEFAQGPGLAAMQAQIGATQALTEGFGDLQRGIELFTSDSTNLNTALSASAGTLQQLAVGMTGNAFAAQQSGDAVQQQTSQFLNWIGVSSQATTAAQQNTAATQQSTAATQQSTAAALTDAQQKQINAVETQILAAENAKLTAQAQSTAAAIMAAGGNIQAQAQALAASSAFIDQLTAAYLRLALAQQTAGQKRIANQNANTTSYGTPVGGAPGRAGTSDVDAVVRLQQAQTAANNAQIDQQRQILQMKGDSAALIKLEQAELAKLAPGTAPYIQQQTRILQLQNQRTTAAGKAGAAAVSAEEKTSGRILAIAQDTAQKLAAIDARVAEERLRNAEKLAQSLRETALDMAGRFEADDLDLVGADPEQLDELADREAAQAKARLSQIEAVKEAQRVADEEGADVAQATFDARQQQIQQQQELDEKYYAKQRELAGDPALLAELETQYQEATAIYSAQAADQIAVAQAAAAAKAQAVEAEKQAVLGAAAEQAAALGNTGKAAGSAESRVRDLQSALSSLPKNVSTTITINEVRSSSGGGSSSSSAGATAGGGSSGSGSSTGGGSGSAPPKASAQRVGAQSSGRVSAQSIVDDAANAAIGALQGGTTPVITAPSSGGGGGGGGSAASAASGDAGDQLDQIRKAIDTLDAVAELSKKLTEGTARIDMNQVEGLATDALSAAQIFGRLYVQLSKEQGEGFGIFTTALQDAISVLDAMAGLRKALLDAGPPIDQATIQQYAQEAFQASQALGSLFVLLTEQQGENFEIYTTALENSIAPLERVAALRKALVDLGLPLDLMTVNTLAGEARLVYDLLRNTLRPTSEDEADEVERFTKSQLSSIEVLQAMGEARKALAEPQPPISEEYVTQLADNAAMIEAIFRSRLVPISEDQADQASRWADAVGSSTSAAQSVLGLTQEMFANYSRPSDAQLSMIADDAQRITDAFAQSARTLEQSDAARAWAEAVNATFGAVNTGLEAIDRINLSQVGLDRQQLATFQESALALIDSAAVISARAATIPAATIGAWQNVTSALNNQAQMMNSLAAVPSFASGALLGSGNESGAPSIGDISIILQPGAIVAGPNIDTASLVNMLGNAVMVKLEERLSGYRSR